MNSRGLESQGTAVESCILQPASSSDSADYLKIPFDAPSNVSQLECWVAWAWLLHLYTGQDGVCFAVRSRNIAACHNIESVITVQDLLKAVEIDSIENVSCCNTAVLFGNGTTEMESYKACRATYQTLHEFLC